MSTTQEYKRFVPQGSASLADDAPGWSGSRAERIATNDAGPKCWKCRGNGSNKTKKAKGSNVTPTKECAVCKGRGRLAVKRKEVEGASQPGTITRGRRRPSGWKVSGPTPHALTEATKWSTYVQEANKGNDVQIQESSDEDRPNWIPRMGEQLCNLVGSFRILQRVGSHRWTTDDLVTAYVASREVEGKGEKIRYLDLGTGNGSVLQMVTWALLKDKHTVEATGIEARLEAVEFARRSLSFNVGNDSSAARIVHGDFRDAALDGLFELVTGTPPYFRVDFEVSPANETVKSAVINQGGMPTAKQSAPARCEFRGGIEAYCEAASRVLLPKSGRFVVCENWLNHDRVVEAAEKYDLQILSQVEVSGRKGRDTLFCVYVMKRKDSDATTPGTKRESLVVRDGNGNWTRLYEKSVLTTMSIPYPTVSLSDN